MVLWCLTERNRGSWNACRCLIWPLCLSEWRIVLLLSSCWLKSWLDTFKCVCLRSPRGFYVCVYNDQRGKSKYWNDSRRLSHIDRCLGIATVIYIYANTFVSAMWRYKSNQYISVLVMIFFLWLSCQKYLLCNPAHQSAAVDEHFFLNESASQVR